MLPISVTVLSDKLESDTYDVRDDEYESSTYRIVIGAEAGTLISEFKDNMLNDNEYIKIYDQDDNELLDDDIVKTGLIIKLVIDNVERDVATMIVRGDIDGDGFVNITDSLKIKNHLQELSLIEDYIQFKAADVVEDDIINVSDRLKVTNYLKELIDTLNE